MMTTVDKIEEIFKKINLAHRLQSEVPMADRSSFKTGGSAQWLFTPESKEEARIIWAALVKEHISPVILGKGANILVSDRGIRGLVLDMGGLADFGLEEGLLWAQAGLDPSHLVEFSMAQGISALEFLYAMPSSLGGAVYMNARCYDREIADVLEKVLVVNEEGNWETLHRDKTTWAYKDSPFMHRKVLILQAWFKTTKLPSEKIQAVMEEHKKDREEKGHFRAPCAGSYFKNNRDFGAPSGVLIDRLGLKGLRLGGAQVAPWHGNILINENKASASEVRALGNLVKKQVFEATGFSLEEEVLFLGEW